MSSAVYLYNNCMSHKCTIIGRNAKWSEKNQRRNSLIPMRELGQTLKGKQNLKKKSDLNMQKSKERIIDRWYRKDL